MSGRACVLCLSFIGSCILPTCPSTLKHYYYFYFVCIFTEEKLMFFHLCQERLVYPTYCHLSVLVLSLCRCTRKHWLLLFIFCVFLMRKSFICSLILGNARAFYLLSFIGYYILPTFNIFLGVYLMKKTFYICSLILTNASYVLVIPPHPLNIITSVLRNLSMKSITFSVSYHCNTFF